jgi:hypothetical protein
MAVEIVLKTIDNKLAEEITFPLIGNHLLLLLLAQNTKVILIIILFKYKIPYYSYMSIFVSEFSKNRVYV